MFTGLLVGEYHDLHMKSRRFGLPVNLQLAKRAFISKANLVAEKSKPRDYEGVSSLCFSGQSQGLRTADWIQKIWTEYKIRTTNRGLGTEVPKRRKNHIL